MSSTMFNAMINCSVTMKVIWCLLDISVLYLYAVPLLKEEIH